MDWHYSLSGLLVGVVVGMTGVGGGSLMTPLLVMVFGVAPATAIGTDLLYAGFTKAGGTVARSRLGSVNWRVAALLAMGSVPAAMLTSYLLSNLVHQGHSVAGGLTKALGVALLLSAFALAFKQKLHGLGRRGAHWLPRQASKNIAPLTIGLGAALGVLVTLTSVGAGALGVVALLLLYPQLSANDIAGTDISHAVPLTLVAGAGHAIAGTVNYGLLTSLLIGSLPGIILGCLIAHRMPESLLRQALAAVLFFVGIKLLV